MSFDLVREELIQILSEKGAAVSPIEADTPLLNGPLDIDSLDLATLVVALEEKTGLQPFREGFVLFHTAGELAALFTKAA
ncbi:acyl carrier protein [Asticcacaulis excentricus]|uniref:Phosphopantetheine-binding protein n=1 Tax=Asticcacaulis excentricus (strain ATCC 15261 / DSM 4724 / KCTC 12464 / NCIMB 9791 / VKM B-1370 / CB 48) TaxID=573065 RepID=E8RLY4_ASTEC|nr:acyl carrier protein [Asticcacaulis excentricus]ADU13803.1 phosphopantetheine-binding protein [Asticcacaulis excentricus CB 48]